MSPASLGKPPGVGTPSSQGLLPRGKLTVPWPGLSCRASCELASTSGVLVGVPAPWGQRGPQAPTPADTFPSSSDTSLCPQRCPHDVAGGSSGGLPISLGALGPHPFPAHLAGASPQVPSLRSFPPVWGRPSFCPVSPPAQFPSALWCAVQDRRWLPAHLPTFPHGAGAPPAGGCGDMFSSQVQSSE